MGVQERDRVPIKARTVLNVLLSKKPNATEARVSNARVMVRCRGGEGVRDGGD